MKLQFLGTGSIGASAAPLTSFLIDEAILFDIGTSTIRQLQTLHADISKIKYIIITHHHSDHLSDMITFLAKRLVIYGQTLQPLTIIGPKDIKNAIKDIVRIYFANEERPINYVDSMTYLELTDNNVQLDNYNITAHTVLHGACVPCNGYQINQLGFSGDSAKCPGLDAIVEQSQILFLDSTLKEANTYGHLNLDGILEYAKQYPEKHFYLIHRGEGYSLSNLPKNVTAPKDGDIIEL